MVGLNALSLNSDCWLSGMFCCIVRHRHLLLLSKLIIKETYVAVASAVFRSERCHHICLSCAGACSRGNKPWKHSLLAATNSVNFLVEKIIALIGFCQCDVINGLKIYHFSLFSQVEYYWLQRLSMPVFIIITIICYYYSSFFSPRANFLTQLKHDIN